MKNKGCKLCGGSGKIIDLNDTARHKEGLLHYKPCPTCSPSDSEGEYDPECECGQYSKDELKRITFAKCTVHPDRCECGRPKCDNPKQPCSQALDAAYVCHGDCQEEWSPKGVLSCSYDTSCVECEAVVKKIRTLITQARLEGRREAECQECKKKV